MLASGQKVYYNESNKILKRKKIYLGVVRKLKGQPKFVVINKNDKVIGTIQKTVRAIELTIFNGIRLEVSISL